MVARIVVMRDLEQYEEVFLRPKDAWMLLGMSRSSFYDYAKKYKEEGFPQIIKHHGMSVVSLSALRKYQEAIKAANA